MSLKKIEKEIAKLHNKELKEVEKAEKEVKQSHITDRHTAFMSMLHGDCSFKLN